MGAVTEYYVNLATGNDTTGNGTSGNPWLTIQKALNTITRDATNGDRINCASSGTNSAALSFTTYSSGGGTQAAPLIIEGYTTTAGDGGRAAINCNGASFINSAVVEGVYLCDLDLSNSNTGAGQPCVQLDKHSGLFRCTIRDAYYGYQLANSYPHFCVACGFTEIDQTAILSDHEHDLITDNWIVDGSTLKLGGYGISVPGTGANIHRNIISLASGSAASGIGCVSVITQDASITHNSIFGPNGTGRGIYLVVGTGDPPALVANNLIQGFNGAGGDGIEISGTTRSAIVMDGNCVSDATTKYNLGENILLPMLDNESLSGNVFAFSGANTFANRFTYWAPLDVGNVWAGAFPQGSGRDKGAVQHVAAAAQTLLISRKRRVI
jgi:hypothetical protein